MSRTIVKSPIFGRDLAEGDVSHTRANQPAIFIDRRKKRSVLRIWELLTVKCELWGGLRSLVRALETPAYTAWATCRNQQEKWRSAKTPITSDTTSSNFAPRSYKDVDRDRAEIVISLRGDVKKNSMPDCASGRLTSRFARCGGARLTCPWTASDGR